MKNAKDVKEAITHYKVKQLIELQKEAIKIVDVFIEKALTEGRSVICVNVKDDMDAEKLAKLLRLQDFIVEVYTRKKDGSKLLIIEI